jgi:hypothetical protein
LAAPSKRTGRRPRVLTPPRPTPCRVQRRAPCEAPPCIDVGPRSCKMTLPMGTLPRSRDVHRASVIEKPDANCAKLDTAAFAPLAAASSIAAGCDEIP